MPLVVPERIAKAIEHLAPQPGERLLEIGCGRGVAAGLVCDRIGSGMLVAIDRSAIAVAATRTLCSRHIDARRLAVNQASLAELALGLDSIDRAFAINVNLFWIKPQAELGLLREALAPGGALHLYFEAPSPSKGLDIRERLASNLPVGGYEVRACEWLPMQRGELLAVTAVPR